MKRTSYHPFAKFLHWTIVIIIATQFLSAWLMPSFRHMTAPNSFTMIHLSAWGLLVIPFGLLLFFMRFFRPVAKVEGEMPSWMEKSATSMQYALYVLLIITPFSGWASVSMRHLPVDFFDLFYLPVLDIDYPSFMFTLGRMHSNIAYAIGILALGHIAAALYHHFILKDQVLNRMRPSRGV